MVNENVIANLIQQYGAIVSTEGIDGDIKKKCNKQLDRLVNALIQHTDRLLANNAGLIT